MCTRRFIRQKHGPTVSFVIDDPAGGQFYRLSESARFFLGLLDGRRTVDEAWEACLAQLGDDAPTQKECIELLAQMQLYGLLVGDQPISADMVPERQSRDSGSRRLKQRTGNWMFLQYPACSTRSRCCKGLRAVPQSASGGCPVLSLGLVACARCV